MGWVAVWNPNPGDTRPISWRWDGPEIGGKLTCTSSGMLGAVQKLATVMDPVYATPTGPMFTPDLAVSWLAFAVVYEMAMRAGLDPEHIEVRGDGWKIPRMGEEAPPGVLF
jgi:hypothetical protein